MYYLQLVLPVLLALLSAWFFIAVIVVVVLGALAVVKKQKTITQVWGTPKYQKAVLLPISLYLLIILVVSMFNSLQEGYLYARSLVAPASAQEYGAPATSEMDGGTAGSEVQTSSQ